MLEPLPSARQDLVLLYGRCLLRFHAYELLMKRLVASHSVVADSSGARPADPTLEEFLGRSSLGINAGRFFETFVVRSGSNVETSQDAHEPDASATSVVKAAYRVEMDSAAYEAEKEAVRALIDLRNDVSHHFLERFNIESAAVLPEATLYLTDACERVGNALEVLRSWYRTMLEGQHIQRDFLMSPAAEAFFDGIEPDGSVDWSRAAIVTCMREAIAANAQARDVEGWIPLDLAVSYVVAAHPRHTPDRYGCISWRQVLNDSRHFDLRYVRGETSRKIAYVRER